MAAESKLLIAILLSLPASGQVYFAPAAGVARAGSTAQTLTLGNAVLQATWQVTDGTIRGGEVRDLIAHRPIAAQPSPFVLLLKDGRAIPMSGMRITATPKIADVPAQPAAASAAERIAGRQIT